MHKFAWRHMSQFVFGICLWALCFFFAVVLECSKLIASWTTCLAYSFSTMKWLCVKLTMRFALCFAVMILHRHISHHQPLIRLNVCFEFSLHDNSNKNDRCTHSTSHALFNRLLIFGFVFWKRSHFCVNHSFLCVYWISSHQFINWHIENIYYKSKQIQKIENERVHHLFWMFFLVKQNKFQIIALFRWLRRNAETFLHAWL